MASYTKAVQQVLKGYRTENKKFATLAIGCTGGKHRSVAMANKIAELLAKEDDIKVTVSHRDLGRE
jgi:UPF0042 nucleotide-binding protein